MSKKPQLNRNGRGHGQKYCCRPNYCGGVLLAENPIDTSANQQRFPRVAAYSPDHTNPYLVIFTDGWNDPFGDVRGYLVNGDGHPVQLVNIATVPGIREEYADIASSEEQDDYAVVWLKTDGETHLWTRRIDQNGSLGTVHQESEPTNPVNLPEPALAMGAPLTLITWEDPVPSTLTWRVGWSATGVPCR